MIRNQAELNGIPSDMEDLWISNFPVSGKRNLILNQQQSMKQLTIGFNALNSISKLELNGLGALESVVVMRGGLTGGTDRLRVVNCANLSSIDIGELAFTKYKHLELTNLPMLQGISFGKSAFQSIQTILMESNGENEMINQTCLRFNRFNWETMHFRETVVTDAR